MDLGFIIWIKVIVVQIVTSLIKPLNVNTLSGLFCFEIGFTNYLLTQKNMKKYILTQILSDNMDSNS